MEASPFESAIHPIHKIVNYFIYRIAPCRGLKQKNQAPPEAELPKGAMHMKTIYVGASKLHNVTGRIRYTNAIKNEKKKEITYATFDTKSNSSRPDFKYWVKLARECNQEFYSSGNAGRIDEKTGKKYVCCQAREFILELPNQYEKLYEGHYDYLAEFLAKKMKEKYDVESNVAIHQNEAKSNFHAHVIFSERVELAEPEITTADRNIFLNADGSRSRTKKAILDENNELLEGCSIIKKGEIVKKDTSAIKTLI